jgi:V/A-type H+-transporting ATPase subunit E
MGLEEILASIKSDTETRYSKIIADAKAEAGKIIEDAKARSESISARGRVDGEKEAQEEKQRSIASAHLESKRRLLEARDELLRDYEERAYGYLKEFTRSSKYKDYLLRMVRDGVSKIGSGAIVQTNSSDHDTLDDSGSRDFEVSKENLSCIGGAIVSSKDGKRRVDNTLESIFNERKEDLRLKLTEQVFGKHD